MSIFKKNVWLIFYLLLLSSMSVLTAISVARWNSLNEFYQTSQEGLAAQWFSAFSSLLEQQEAILTLTGESILQSEAPQGPGIQSKLDRMMEINPDFFSGFALISKTGEVIEVSSNLDGENFPNLLTLPEVRSSFLYALATDKMVLGRTYHAPRFVIPARKAVRNTEGDVLAVMTGALRLDSNGGFFSRNRVLGPFNQISIVREQDWYFQYATNGQLIQDFHQRKAIDSLIESLKAASHSSAEAGTTDQQTFRISYNAGADRGEVQGVAFYNSRYEYWLISDIPASFLFRRFLESFAGYLAIFLTFQIAMFFVFRYIDRIEKGRREQLQFLADHDALTQLPNRNYLLSRFEAWVQDKSSFSLLFIDLDNFKGINDSFGHSIGDIILIELAERFRNVVGDNDLLIRHGGDEFVLLTDGESRSECEQRAVHLINQACERVVAQDLSFELSCSIGIAQFPEHGQELDSLLKASDIAMYEAKKKKASIEVFRPEMENAYIRRITLERALNGAHDRGEVFMMYQPQVDKHGALIGVEALVRWQHPELGMIPPDEFIPIAESSGKMGSLGRFIVERSLNQIASLQRKNNQRFQLSINISATQFSEPGFAGNLICSIEEAGIPVEQVCLEITESQFIEELDSTTAALDELISEGIRISLDDFGTGYSSLSILRDLAINELKIDKSFVRNILWDDTSLKMVKNIISIGRLYNLQILAEGVETEAEMQALRQCGCDLFQGYLFSKPIDIEGLEKMLKSNSLR